MFADERAFEFFDESHSSDEDRYLVIGLTGKGLITVVYTVREEVCRIITAWHSTRQEERLYEEW